MNVRKTESYYDNIKKIDHVLRMMEGEENRMCVTDDREELDRLRLYYFLNLSLLIKELAQLPPE